MYFLFQDVRLWLLLNVHMLKQPSSKCTLPRQWRYYLSLVLIFIPCTNTNLYASFISFISLFMKTLMLLIIANEILGKWMNYLTCMWDKRKKKKIDSSFLLILKNFFLYSLILHNFLWNFFFNFFIKIFKNNFLFKSEN